MRKVCGTPVGFQSTLPRRERPRCVAARPCAAHFNPRSREGSDAAPTGLYAQFNSISIHAPAKGATQTAIDPEGNQGISIHAPAKGATIAQHDTSNTSRFQSTLPRRERRAGGGVVCMDVYFNPRSREGSDARVCACVYLLDISIHAPAKGATYY